MTASPEEHSQNDIFAQMNEVFKGGEFDLVKNRIQMAAIAIRESVARYDAVKSTQHESYEGIPSAETGSDDINLLLRGLNTMWSIPRASAYDVPIQSNTESVDQTGQSSDEHDELMENAIDPSTAAKLGRQASIEGARAAYNLSFWQAQKAVRLSRKND